MTIKKIIKISLICLTLFFCTNIILPVHAADTGVPEINQQMEQFGEKTPVSTVELPVFVGRIIRWVLAIIGVILIAIIIYGGLTYATAAGSEEKTGTAKKILVYAIIGVIIIALAYVLSSFIIDALFESKTSIR
ncbi:MAG: hypothetical protein WC663_00675 [Patescibacteria group bacterium]